MPNILFIGHAQDHLQYVVKIWFWGVEMTDKEFALKQIKLLSALESWTFATKEVLPQWLHEELKEVVEVLSKELLK